jgi:hypothetical protein
MSDRYSAGAVVWAPDPYAEAGRPRPWLVLAADGLPFAGEEYCCAGLTLSDHAANLAVSDDWIAGGNPDRTSYCSPWVLATVKHDAVVNPQGRVTDDFTARVIRHSIGYLAADLDVDPSATDL